MCQFEVLNSFHVNRVVAVAQSTHSRSIDYMAALRINISKAAYSSPYQHEHYFDGIKHWMTRCEQLEEQQVALLDEIAKLQMKIEALYQKPTTLRQSSIHRNQLISPSAAFAHLENDLVAQPQQDEKEASTFTISRSNFEHDPISLKASAPGRYYII